MAVTILDYALLTLDEVKDRLGITVTTYDDILTSMINSITAYAENLIGRDIVVREKAIAEKFDIHEYQRAIFLRNYPIVSIESVVDNDETLDITDDYLKDDDTGKLIRVGNFWNKGYQEVVVTYKGGYSEVPWDIKEWAYQTISLLYRSKDTHGRKSERVGDLAVTYGQGAISALENDNILKSYRSNAY